MHVFGAIQLTTKVHQVLPVDLLNENYGNAVLPSRSHQAACDSASLLPSAGERYAVLFAWNVFAATLEIHHDQRRPAHDQRTFRVHLLGHASLTSCFLA